MKKPLAPGEKQSGLKEMQVNSSSWLMESHEQFILDELLPLVVGYAKRNGHPTEAVALASFLALSTVLQSKGATLANLTASIGASSMNIHNAPEGLQ